MCGIVCPIGHVAELVYAYVSEAYGVILGSSSLPMPTASAASGGNEKVSNGTFVGDLKPLLYIKNVV
jgi:hypothetical protein